MPRLSSAYPFDRPGTADPNPDRPAIRHSATTFKRKSLRLEGVPDVTLRPAPGRRASARSALAIAFAAHAGLAVILCAIVLPGTGRTSASPAMSLRIIDPDPLPRPDDSPVPDNTRVAPPLPGLVRSAPEVPESSSLPEIEVTQAPLALDSASFGGPPPFAMPPEPVAPRKARPSGPPQPPAATPPRSRPAVPTLASAAVPRSTPQPAYPALAIRETRSGTVQVRLHVNAEGRVTESALARSSGHPDLDQAALRTTARWRFRPARATDGSPVASRVVVPVVFALR